MGSIMPKIKSCDESNVPIFKKENDFTSTSISSIPKVEITVFPLIPFSMQVFLLTCLSLPMSSSFLGYLGSNI